MMNRPLLRVVVTVLALLTPAAALAQPAGRSTVMDFGAAGDGIADDTAPLQAALNRGMAIVPCGSYRITQTLLMRSRTSLIGMGECSVIVLDARIPAHAGFPVHAVFGVTNADHARGNTGLTVKDVAFDAREQDFGDTHHLHFRNVDGVLVDGVVTYAGGDGVAFTQARHFRVLHARIVRAANAGLDTWDGSTDGLFADSVIDGEGIAQYGALATGVGLTEGEPRSTARIAIRGLSIRGVVGTGIQLNGGSETSRIRDCVVVGNTIDDGALIGIRAAEADGTLIEANTISGAQISIVLAGEFVGAGQFGAILGNVIRDNRGHPAISVQYRSSGWVLAGNVAVGANRMIQLDDVTSGNVVGADNRMVVKEGGWASAAPPR
jgi:hypothetical protein